MSYLMTASFFLTVFMCAFMLVGCICRVRLLSFKRSGLMWILLYTLLVSIAAKLMLDLLFIGESSAMLGLVVAAGDAHLIATWQLWRIPPPYTARGFSFDHYRNEVKAEILAELEGKK